MTFKVDLVGNYLDTHIIHSHSRLIKHLVILGEDLTELTYQNPQEAQLGVLEEDTMVEHVSQTRLSKRHMKVVDQAALHTYLDMKGVFPFKMIQ